MQLAVAALNVAFGLEQVNRNIGIVTPSNPGKCGKWSGMLLLAPGESRV
jgi:hypothetical protein